MYTSAYANSWDGEGADAPINRHNKGNFSFFQFYKMKNCATQVSQLSISSVAICMPATPNARHTTATDVVGCCCRDYIFE